MSSPINKIWITLMDTTLPPRVIQRRKLRTLIKGGRYLSLGLTTSPRRGSCSEMDDNVCQSEPFEEMINDMEFSVDWDSIHMGSSSMGTYTYFFPHLHHSQHWCFKDRDIQHIPVPHLLSLIGRSGHDDNMLLRSSGK